MMIPLSTSEPLLWDEEYEKAGIPSSARGEPSNVVREFVETLATNRTTPLCVVDIGCGTGRNSLYLAVHGFNVVAIDYAPAAIARLRHAAEVSGLYERIRIVCQDTSEPWPLDNATADLAIDTFCFKHQIHEQALRSYVAEATRTLKVGGHLLLFLAAREDGYYGRFPILDQRGPGVIIRDPGNNILSRLYNLDEVVPLFSSFSVMRHVVKLARNVMHGSTYERASHVLWLRRE